METVPVKAGYTHANKIENPTRNQTISNHLWILDLNSHLLVINVNAHTFIYFTATSSSLPASMSKFAFYIFCIWPNCRIQVHSVFVPLSAVCLDDVPSLGHPHPHHRHHYHHHRSDSALFPSRHEPNNGQFIKSNYTPNILRLPFNENSNKFWQTFGFRCTELCKFCKLSLARVQWKCLRISKQYLLLLLNKAS